MEPARLFLTLPDPSRADFAEKLSDFLRATRGRRIRCPKCAWEPDRESRWICLLECGTVWNTFETAGRCPGCNRVWQDTACLACHRWSPHVDWYEPDPGGGQRPT